MIMALEWTPHEKNKIKSEKIHSRTDGSISVIIKRMEKLGLTSLKEKETRGNTILKQKAVMAVDKINKNVCM